MHRQYQKLPFARYSQLRSSTQALASSMALHPTIRNRQSPAKSPSPKSIRMLNAESLQLHLNRHNLVTTGKHTKLVERLLRWHTASHRDSETNSHQSRSKSDPDPNHTRTVPESQDNSSSSDRSNDDEGQVDLSSKEVHSSDEEEHHTRSRHPRHSNLRKQHHSHHQCEGVHASRHRQHRSPHQLSERTPVVIALLTSVSEHTPVVIALLTSVS